MTTAVKDRPIWRTVDVRAEDLTAGDVIRNGYGKWDVVTDTKVTKSKLYVDVKFETNLVMQIRTVALVKVQMVKPS